MDNETNSGHDALQLTIDLVPEPCWYANMRAVLTAAQWDTLRRQVYTRFHHRCAICGASGRLHCHEVWSYGDTAHIQRLMGFTSLCALCHHVKHIGLAALLADQGKLDFEQVVRHFLRVNHCTRDVFERHHADAFAQWRERGRFVWTTDLGEYAVLIIGG